MENYNRSHRSLNTYTKIVVATNIEKTVESSVKRVIFDDFEMIHGKSFLSPNVDIEDGRTLWCSLKLELKNDRLEVDFYRRCYFDIPVPTNLITKCPEVVPRISITILDELENKYFLTQLKQNDKGIFSGVVGQKDLILRDIPNILINKLLILEFRIEHFGISMDSAEVYRINHSTENNRVNIFKDYFNNKNFSDVLLKINEKSLPAHRIILSAHSDYFKCLFDFNNMIESQTSEIKLENIDFEVLNNLVYFMYTGYIIDDNQYSHELLIATNYYMVQELKKYCEFHILCKININNICHLMVLAEHSNADILKSAIRFFFNFYKSDILNTEQWKSLKTAEPRICSDYSDDPID